MTSLATPRKPGERITPMSLVRASFVIGFVAMLADSAWSDDPLRPLYRGLGSGIGMAAFGLSFLAANPWPDSGLKVGIISLIPVFLCCSSPLSTLWIVLAMIPLGWSWGLWARHAGKPAKPASAGDVMRDSEIP